MPTKNFHSISLSLTEEQEALLQAQYQQLQQQLEQGLPLQPVLFADLRSSMQTILEGQTDFPDIAKFTAAQHHTLHLMHDNNFILNLPWRLALENRDRIYLSKGLPTAATISDYQATNPLPLKILVMIASPEGGEIQHRLSWEKEEGQIIRAFEKLYENADVQIDFTADGSLESLERKLKENHYHILHFSGHGVYQKGKGYLALEDPITLEQHLVTAEDFAKSINVQPRYRPAIVLLSSCQTAQGSTQEGFRGVSNQLLAAGVPAVIAMGFNILDYYATEFAAKFYQELAEKTIAEQAFFIAIQHILVLENQHRTEQNYQAAQWMIPQLYLNEHISDLVKWTAKKKALKFKAIQLVTGENRLLLGKRPPHYQFLGRRRERKVLFQKLLDNEPILLKGQGGVGKTSMAEHLVERLIAKNPRTYPFVFNENTTWEDIINTLQDFFKKERGDFTIETEVKRYSKKAVEQLQFLLKKLNEETDYALVFIFDNLENFQDGAGGQAFKPDAQDILVALQTLQQSAIFPLLLTGRYPLAEMPNIHSENLNQVGFNDFYKKCQQLALRELQWKLNPKDLQLPIWEKSRKNMVTVTDEQPLTFKTIVELLHQNFGGNYRTLEFFDKLYTQKKEAIYPTLDKLANFQAQLNQEKEAVLQVASKDLVFEELLALLNPIEIATLALLTHFRVPVLLTALEMQQPDTNFGPALQRLVDMTLIEQQQTAKTTQVFYYITPIVRDLLVEHEGTSSPFLQEKAGAYFEYILTEQDGNIGDMEEAFYHYLAAANKEKVNDLGEKLIDFYYGIQLLQSAYYFGMTTEKLVKEETKASILNRLGLILRIYGENELALVYYKKNLLSSRAIGDKSGEAMTLNNISQIYDTRGDYETALNHLEKSLKIHQEVGDKSGEAVALNNIGLIYSTRGDNKTALTYIKQSLRISQGHGDKNEEATAMNNISQIYYARGDFEIALTYLEKSLKIQQETGDKNNESSTLNNISVIYSVLEDYETALIYSNQSLKIAQDVGNKTNESKALHNISQIYDARGDYKTALKYLEQSLKIKQNIGDKSSLLPTMHNMGQAYLKQKNIPKYLEYVYPAYQLANEIKNAMGIYTIGGNLGEFLCRTGQIEKGLPILKKSYAIAQKANFPNLEQLAALIQKYESA